MKKRAEEEDETDEEDEDGDDYRKASKDDPHTCFSASATVAGSDHIGADINIIEYLDKHPNDNFIIEYNTKRECQSLSDLKKQFSEDDPYGIYYECSATLLEKMKDPNFQPWGYGIDDYYTETEYAKVGSTNFFIIKPDWMFDGPVPEPRYFNLVNTGERKTLVNKSISMGIADIVSGIHCEPQDTFDIYRLEPIIDTLLKK